MNRENREDTLAETVGQKVESATAQVEDAAKAVREVTDNFGTALDNSIQREPITTIALAVAFGFVLGALWKA